jgi:hypothetical protein
LAGCDAVGVGVGAADAGTASTLGAVAVAVVDGDPPHADRLSPNVAIRARAGKDLLYFIVGDPQIVHDEHDAHDA